MDNVLFKNKFMKDFYQIMLSQDLVNVTVGLTIATSFTDVTKAINTGIILPILTLFSKNNRHFFQFAPVISSMFLFLLVTFITYVLILLPVNKLRLKNKDNK